GKSSFPPSVYILPPSELTLKEIGTLTCLVKGFYPGDIFVQWLHNDQPVSDEDYFTSKPTMESKTPERFFAYSMLNINPQNWRSGDMYSCLVAHEALPINTTQKAVDNQFPLECYGKQHFLENSTHSSLPSISMVFQWMLNA
uniref:Ig-like domain-containing protein n=1 Tax=Varanus komodoensis TaxID=61221 RepID=A0A8D2Q3E8_VARKO